MFSTFQRVGRKNKFTYHQLFIYWTFLSYFERKWPNLKQRRTWSLKYKIIYTLSTCCTLDIKKIYYNSCAKDRKPKFLHI